MKNKKALSGVVTAAILIAITIAAGAIVGTMIKGFVEERLNTAGSCYNILEKVQINEEFTCYNATGQYTQVSLSLAQISPTKVLVALIYDNESKVYSIYAEEKNIEGLTNYPLNTSGVQLPGNESGKTYLIWNIESKPSKIQVAPMMGETQCEVIDILGPVDNCN